MTDALKPMGASVCCFAPLTSPTSPWEIWKMTHHSEPGLPTTQQETQQCQHCLTPTTQVLLRCSGNHLATAVLPGDQAAEDLALRLLILWTQEAAMPSQTIQPILSTQLTEAFQNFSQAHGSSLVLSRAARDRRLVVYSLASSWVAFVCS